MFHPYTISLDNGKYTIVNDNGIMTFLRYGEAWPAADNLKHSKVVLAMAQRIEALECAIGEVLNGSLDVRGCRRGDGMTLLDDREDVATWRERLRRALEQK